VLRPLAPLLACLAALLLAACGSGGSDGADRPAPQPQIGVKGADEETADEVAAYPQFATKNTPRVGGADPIADAAAIARATFPGGGPGQRPRAVSLVDADDWRAGLVASALVGAPLRAPVLLSDGDELPAASEAALEELDPRGSREAGNAQVIRVGDVARPEGRRTTDLRGRNPAALARAVDSFLAATQGKSSDRVLIVGQDAPEYAMPAAGWAAKSGDPILFAERNRLPPETRAALSAHQQPKIYVLGPERAVGDRVLRELRRLGNVTRIAGSDPVRNAIEFARFTDGTFGWGVVDPGHGLVFASQSRPLDAAAAAPLSASGKYGPLLILPSAGQLPAPLREYLLDIQPGYDEDSDPVRGVYNHGWIVGDEGAVSVPVQARIDELLEISPVREQRPEEPEEGTSTTSTTPTTTSTTPTTTSTTPARTTTAP
jgi:hypothetical protein